MKNIRIAANRKPSKKVLEVIYMDDSDSMGLITWYVMIGEETNSSAERKECKELKKKRSFTSLALPLSPKGIKIVNYERGVKLPTKREIYITI